MKVKPEWRVYALGVTLWAALTLCSRSFADRGGTSFLVSSAVAGIVYLLAIRELFATPRPSGRVLVIGLVVAAVWHVQFLRLPSGADDDIRRYVWDGRVQRLGYNPYVVVPDDPAAQRLHTSETLSLNNPDVPSPYPPGAQIFFRAVTAIRESTLAMRLALVSCELAILLALFDVLRRTQQGHLVLAFAWNPLVAIEVAGSGHVDILGVLFVLLSVAALERRWRATAAVALGVAVAVKFLPIVLLPLYWKRVRLRDAALAASVVGLLYVPFVDGGRIPLGSLGTFVQRFRFNDPVFATLERVAPPHVVAAFAVLVGLLTAAWIRKSSSEWSSAACAWPMAASLLCAPVVYPWYLLWLLPFVKSISTLPILVWTVSIFPTYVVWHLRTLGRPWRVPIWATAVEYGAVAAAAAYLALRQSAAATARCSSELAEHCSLRGAPSLVDDNIRSIHPGGPS